MQCKGQSLGVGTTPSSPTLNKFSMSQLKSFNVYSSYTFLLDHTAKISQCNTVCTWTCFFFFFLIRKNGLWIFFLIQIQSSLRATYFTFHLMKSHIEPKLFKNLSMAWLLLLWPVPLLSNHERLLHSNNNNNNRTYIPTCDKLSKKSKRAISSEGHMSLRLQYNNFWENLHKFFFVTVFCSCNTVQTLYY